MYEGMALATGTGCTQITTPFLFMLDSIVGPSYTNTTTEDDVFGSIIGYMAPVPVVPLTVAPMLKQPEQQGIDEVVVAPKDSPWAGVLIQT